MSTPPENPGFDPNSYNAKFGEVLTELRGMREDFKEFRTDSEARIRALEIENATGRGKTVIISALCAMGLSFVAQWLIKKS